MHSTSCWTDSAAIGCRSSTLPIGLISPRQVAAVVTGGWPVHESCARNSRFTPQRRSKATPICRLGVASILSRNVRTPGILAGPTSFPYSRAVFPGRRQLRAIMRFKGTKNYVATDDLKVAVNAAITLQRPLLVKGEPGTGKTVLAIEVAKAIGTPLSNGTSSRPPRRCRAFTNTMPSAACATASSAIRGSPTSATTSARASCGRRSRWMSALCC